MSVLAQLERQAKAKATDSDLAAVVARAVVEALARAGVITAQTPAPQPPEPIRPSRFARPARSYAPPPDRAPQAQPEPSLPHVVPAPSAPLPKQLRIQRDELGLIKTVSAEPDGPSFTFRRDELGRVALLLVNDKPDRRFLYGADGQKIVGSVPANDGMAPATYNGRVVPPASINARST